MEGGGKGGGSERTAHNHIWGIYGDRVLIRHEMGSWVGNCATGVSTMILHVFRRGAPHQSLSFIPEHSCRTPVHGQACLKQPPYSGYDHASFRRSSAWWASAMIRNNLSKLS